MDVPVEMQMMVNPRRDQNRNSEVFTAMTMFQAN